MFLKDLNDYLKDVDDITIFESVQMQFKTKTMRKFVKRKRRYFNPFSDLKEQEFRLKYRFTKENMRKIIETIRDDLEVDQHLNIRTNQVPVELQIMAAIRFWGYQEHPRITATCHNISIKTLRKICRRVAAALASKASRYIRMPATLAEKENVTKAFQELAHMPMEVVGVVAHFSVYFRRSIFESHNGEADFNDSHMQIQIVSDASLKIRDLDCRLLTYENEDGLSKMFTQSRIKERFEQNEFRGRLLLGGNYLPCSSYLFTPIKCAINPEELSYNRSHAITFGSAAKCFDLWRQRFEILGSEMSSSINAAKHTILAVAILHNMAVEWNDPSLNYKLYDIFYGNNLLNGFHLNSTQPPVKNEDIHARSEFIKNNF